MSRSLLSRRAALDVIDLIDELGEAEDRLTALMLMVDGMPDRGQSSAFSRVVGDVQLLVAKVHDALDEQQKAARHG